MIGNGTDRRERGTMKLVLVLLLALMLCSCTVSKPWPEVNTPMEGGTGDTHEPII